LICFVPSHFTPSTINNCSMVEEILPLGVEVTSSTQVFPESTQDNLSVIPLSIIDSTVSYFARCAGIWFYDSPIHSQFALSGDGLKSSLSKALNSYRPWTGRLSYVSPNSDGGHTTRYRRVQVTYNAHTDLGVTFVTARSPKNMSDFIPSVASRKTSHKLWNPSKMPSGELLPQTRMALSSGNPPLDAPNMMVQVTTFACGSTSIGIALAHGLADAQSMCTFAKYWASTNRAIHSSKALPTLSPIFDPELLDSAAAGNIDADSPDASLIEEARSLPQHRFDWYKEVPGQPWPVTTPADFEHSAILSPSDPIPWGDWETSAPEAGRVFHFTAAEVQHIYDQAKKDPSSRISKHDTLLAHMWLLINQARQLPPQTTTYLNLTMGLRSRLSLPPNFLGSPIMITAIPWTLTDSVTSLATLAARIRSTLQRFTPSAIGACLHDAAFEVSPQRLWRAFLGSKHILQTSWIQSGFQEVDFLGGSGPKLRYVQPEMGGDGLLLVMEALGEEKGHWSVNGVDVNLYLEASAMQRLLKDSSLWGEGVV
jgi:hypothetical protein